jgi:hypothetical protein
VGVVLTTQPFGFAWPISTERRIMRREKANRDGL